MIIMPLYSSVLDDGWRLAFCLAGHPLLLEVCLISLRAFERDDSPHDRKMAWNHGGKENFRRHRGHVAFIVEAVMVFDRRFMIG